jgi:hypothetical protein
VIKEEIRNFIMEQRKTLSQRICEVQPMTPPNGLIFFLDYVYRPENDAQRTDQRIHSKQEETKA